MSENRRILHLIKTLDGATWAFHQIHELVKQGWEIHVAAPLKTGRHLADLQRTGATLHVLPVEWPTKAPWKLPQHSSELRHFVSSLAPCIIHSHFVSTTLMARYALRDMGIKRVFQVPGPLHLEHRLFGMWETMTADSDDWWVASSDYIRQLYLQGYGLPAERVGRSYYGINLTASEDEKFLRQQFDIPESAFLVGNVSYFYPPKIHLGQQVGIKGHELMLEALEKLLPAHKDLWAIFIGGPWSGAENYYQKLKARAELVGGGRIIFSGSMPNPQVLRAWREINLAMHVPVSENCGGVVEPLLASTPVLAAQVGGLPEVILNQKTGLLIPRNTQAITDALEWALSHRKELPALGEAGHRHILNLFGREKTSMQIDALYKSLLGLEY